MPDNIYRLIGISLLTCRGEKPDLTSTSLTLSILHSLETGKRRWVMVDQRFSIVDYVVFSIMLMISALIGIWYGCGPGGKQKTTSEYLLANRKMRYFPVAISLLVSYLSAITLLGVPSEVYTYGAQYYVLILSYFIICGTVAIVFVPMFRRVNITCANEVRLCSLLRLLNLDCLL